MVFEATLLAIAAVILLWRVIAGIFKGNILSVCLWMLFAFLYHAQAYFLLTWLDEDAMVFVLNHRIDKTGFFAAMVMLFMATASAATFEQFFESTAGKHSRLAMQGDSTSNFCDLRFGRLRYAAVVALIVLCAAFLASRVGGIEGLLGEARPGQGATGIYLAVLGLCISYVPVALRLAAGSRGLPADWAVFVAGLALIAFVSRIFAILLLFAIVLILFADYRFGFAKPAKAFLVGLLAVIGFLIFFVWGALRDAQDQTGASEIAIAFEFLLDSPQRTIANLEFNYQVGIEGMTSLAGAATTSLEHLPDLGLTSLTQVLLRAVPGALRHEGDIFEQVNKLFWYQDSTVPSGLTCMFVHFHLFGGALFGLIFALITSAGTASLRRAYKAGDVQRVVVLAFILACSIFFLRGTIAVWLSTVLYGGALIAATTFWLANPVQAIARPKH
jgi:hypothetical protein